MAARLRVTQVKSAIGYKKDQGLTLKALGLGKMWRSVEKDDTPAIRGMLNKVRHLVRVEEATPLPEAMARPAEFTVLALPGTGEESAEKPKGAPKEADAAHADEAAAGALASDTESTEEPAKPARRARKPKTDDSEAPPVEASASSEEPPAKPRRSRKPAAEGPETTEGTDEGEIVS